MDSDQRNPRELWASSTFWRRKGSEVVKAVGCVLVRILFVLFALTPVEGSQVFTYYVDSVAGSDANPGTLQLPWKTIAKVNTTNLKAGQSVGFKCGSLWRETLEARQSGKAGSPVTFGSYGVSGAMPVITGADVLSGPWISGFGTPPNVYSAPRAAPPGNIYVDGSDVPLAIESSLASVTPGSWYWAAGTLYLQLSGSSNPNAHTIEGSTRT